jgi:hypothetical protein
MNHAMLDLIKNPKSYSQFEDIIKSHFKIKKNEIITLCEKWTREAPELLKSQYQSALEKIKIEIEKI